MICKISWEDFHSREFFHSTAFAKISPSFLFQILVKQFNILNSVPL